jgi:signal transduction histidine kinase
VWNVAGIRGFPVNAELHFDRANSAVGRVRTTGRPARADYERSTGELPVQMRASDFRSSVAAPVLLGDEIWGAVVAVTTREQPLPEGSEDRLLDYADLVALAIAGDERRLRAADAQRRIVEASDDTRRRLERELHEGVQQHLLALMLMIRTARARANTGSDAVGKLLDDALAEAAVANTALQELARKLYPIVLTERGLAAALQALIARAGVPVYMRELPRRRFPALVEATAYFVVADALAVAREHGREVAAIVSDRGHHLLVELRSDGALGADALADRVAAVGGHFHLGSLPDGGFVLRAEIPIEADFPPGPPPGVPRTIRR